MVLNTVDDAYVIGPNVSAAQKREIHAHLIEAHDRIVTIHYIYKQGSAGTIRHKRITALIIEESSYLLPH